jgi:hypothetical protein
MRLERDFLQYTENYKRLLKLTRSLTQLGTFFPTPIENIS